MPYRHAWLFVLALIATTVLAFWPSYFSVLHKAPIAFHLHGLTASLWLALLVAQSWTVHHGRRALHRSLGQATFVAVPLFIMGGFAVIQSMARATAAGTDPFYQIYGARLASYDVLATATFAWMVGMALKERRNVQLHARYMLATTLLLIGPVLARVTDRFLPGFIIRGPQDFALFAWNVHLVALIGIAIALWLYAANRRFGRPWLIVAGVTLLQSIVFETVARTAIWRGLFESVALVPTPLWLAIGVVAGIALVWFSWTARPARRPRVVTA